MSSEKNSEELFYKLSSDGLVDMRKLELLGKFRGHRSIYQNKEILLKIYHDQKNRNN